MIHTIYSSLSSFKTLRFGKGLNVLVADKSTTATARDTRNRAGKTSVVEIVNFLMAGEARPDSLMRNPSLAEHSFGMAFDLAGNRTSVERTGQESNRVRIIEGATDGWPVTPQTDEEYGHTYITNDQWRKTLGFFMFGLPDNPLDGDFGPSFRQLFPYFARRNPEGFISPHMHFSKAKRWTWQVALTYLFGLDWTIPRDWQRVRDRQERLKKLKAEIGEGTLAHIVGKAASLRSELVNLEENAKRLRVQLKGYNVHPEYRRFEKEASDITRAISEMSNQNTVDRQLIADLEDAIASEHAPLADDLERLYAEVGVVLPDHAIRRFEEVRSFHESVVRNRHSYLNGELVAARQRIVLRESEQATISARRAELMSFLESHHALDVFTELQAELSRTEAQAETVRKRFQVAKEIEGETAQLKIEYNQLLLRLQRDYTEQEGVLRDTISTFGEISGQLYRDPGVLTIQETDNGPEFNIQIQGERSAGIANMQIFTFDMTLMTILSRRDMGTGSLVHDSHLFDPVDGRQVGTALEVGSRLAEELGFQYIVMLNSDELNRIEVPAGFDLQRHILPTRLTDDKEDGGLFGFRFD